MKTIIISLLCLLGHALCAQQVDPASTHLSERKDASHYSIEQSPSMHTQLANDSVLYASLNAYHQATLAAHLTELQSSTKANWLKYLPTLGLAYTPDGKPRPTVSWSSTLLYSSHKQRQSIEAKRRAIIKKSELDRQADLIRLDGLLRKRLYLLEDIEAQHQQFQLDQQLFDIENKKYENHQILPSEYLRIKRDYIKKEYTLQQRQQELMELKNSIFEAARFRE